MATLQELLNLITSEHSSQSNFREVLTAVIQPFVDGQNLMGTVNALYDVDVAVGQQLDVVGQWVGFPRQLRAPIESVYFAFDVYNLGFDQGVWWSPGQPLDGVISLDDTTYRLMIMAKIAANISDGTTTNLEEVLALINPGTFIIIQDNFDMTITLYVAGIIPSGLYLRLLANDYIPYRPGAVKIDGVYVVTEDGPIFGFDVNNDHIAGFDEGSWGYLVPPLT